MSPDAELLASIEDDCQQSSDALLVLLHEISSAVDEFERRNDVDWLSASKEDLVACVSGMREIATKYRNNESIDADKIEERRSELAEILSSIQPRKPSKRPAAVISKSKRGQKTPADRETGAGDEIDSDEASGDEKTNKANDEDDEYAPIEMTKTEKKHRRKRKNKELDLILGVTDDTTF